MRQWAIPAAAIALPLCLIAELLPIRSYSTADGLAADSINKIVADSRGFVWFCTPEGLSRFDGYRFVNFGVAEGLPHRSLNALLETRAGEYLVGTQRGLCQFQAEGGGKFTTYLPGNNPYENAVNSLMQDSAGRIWCGTADGLFEMLTAHRFRRQSLPAPPPGRERISIADLLEDTGHRLWLATRSGIYVIDKDGTVRHIEMGGPTHGTQNVRTLLQDRYGRIWAGTQDGLVLVRDADKEGRYGVQHVYRGAGDVKHLDVTSLAEGPDGELWAGASAGIVRWLPGERQPAFRMLTRAQGLIDRQVNTLATDRAGNMWAATEAAGVMKIQPGGFTTFREQDGLATDRVWSLVADRTGTVVAVTTSESPHDAVNLFDGARFHAMSVGVSASTRPGDITSCCRRGTGPGGQRRGRAFAGTHRSGRRPWRGDSRRHVMRGIWRCFRSSRIRRAVSGPRRRSRRPNRGSYAGTLPRRPSPLLETVPAGTSW